MKFFLSLFVLFFILTKAFHQRIVSVISIFRHGARTPINHFEIVKDLFFPFHHGEVTPNGLRQHYLLGRFLRQRYIENKNPEMNILKKNFLKNDIKIYSQNMQRTVNSAVAHLSGLFKNDLIFSEYQEYLEHSLQFSNPNPPVIENDSIFSKSEYVKIINSKFLIINQKNDKILSPRECFKLIREFDNTVFYLTDEEKAKINSLHSLFPSQIESIIQSNYNVRTMKKLLDLIVTTNYHFRNHFNIDKEVLKIFKKYWLKYSYQEKISDSNKKLLVSSFFEAIINNFDNFIYHCRPFKKFIKGKISVKEKFFKQSKDDCLTMMVFSGRDTSLVDIISNLIDEDYINSLIDNNTFEENNTSMSFLIPKFASSFLFELHYDEKTFKYYVKIIYNGQESLRNFKKILGKNINYDSEKGIPYEDFKALLTSRINIEYNGLNCSEFDYEK